MKRKIALISMLLASGCSVANDTSATLLNSPQESGQNWKALISCDDGTLTLDVDAASRTSMQAVINSRHAVDTLLFPNSGTDAALQILNHRVIDGGTKLIIQDLKGAKRTSGFRHIHEGAGYYDAQTASDIYSIDDIDFVGNQATTTLPADYSSSQAFSLDLFYSAYQGASTGLGGSAPIREERTIRVWVGRNNYVFYNCRREQDARTADVIFDIRSNPSLARFSQYLENPQATRSRPGIALTQDGIVGRPGDGNFTAYKFADLPGDSWDLRVVFEIPAGARYSNSGIYLLYDNPNRSFSTLSREQQSAYQAALSQAQNRRNRFGTGPFELDFFSHELQIIAGTDGGIPPENHGPGAFYGIDIGDGEGRQRIVNSYDLTIGDTYEMVLKNRGTVRQTFLRSVKFQQDPVLVSESHNLRRDQDLVRGGAPRALLLQGFFNNGTDVKLPTFKTIELRMRK